MGTCRPSISPPWHHGPWHPNSSSLFQVPTAPWRLKECQSQSWLLAHLSNLFQEFLQVPFPFSNLKLGQWFINIWNSPWISKIITGKLLLICHSTSVVWYFDTCDGDGFWSGTLGLMRKIMTSLSNALPCSEGGYLENRCDTHFQSSISRLFF